MNLENKKLTNLLLTGNYVSKENLDKAVKFAKEYNTTVIEYLKREGLINKDILGQAIAESFKIPYSDLNSHKPTPKQVKKLPEKLARKYRLVIFKIQENIVTISSDKPNKKLAPLFKKLFPKYKTILTYSLTEDINEAFLYYRKSLEARFNRVIKSEQHIATGLMDEILADALLYRSSDIHFEPQEKYVVVRFRVDGILLEAGRLQKKHYQNMVNRIKIKAHLRIDEHFDSQDGSIHHMQDGKPIDLRISIVPTLNGEKIVIRILAQYIQNFSLSNLGLSSHDQIQMENSSKKPFGMILVTGPTGSGKSTTLYATLKMLYSQEINITTIEDPVEYRIPGVNQIQVNEQAGLTFSKGLRSIVRQDPDIILIGEIRDYETADIAINAALTGHLVLSTFHANDAATTIPRLLDMKAEPFLLASTLEAILAQRLVRKICEHCKISNTVTPAMLKKENPGIVKYFGNKKVTLYKGKGCESCNNTGFSGRIGIFELIINTPELQALILKNPSSHEINALARKQGTKSMFEDGIEKTKQGVTTLEEILRVAKPPQ